MDFEKAQQKKMERETKRAQSVLIEERKKHMSVVKALLDEHRYLQNELAEALQRLEQADCEAHACKVDARKAMAMLSEERQKAEKREAEIERQISEFDIEREQLVGKLKREESRTKKLQETLDEANGRVSELEHVLELSRELSQKDSSSDNVTRTKSAELKGTEDNNSSGPLSYRPKSSTFPSSTSGQANLTRSSKLFAPRGFKSPLRTSESSSGSSEELSSPNTQKINVRTKNRSSGDFAAKRGSNDSLERISGDETVIDVHSTSVSIKPKVASITPSRRTTEAARKGLSPANSVDKLATKERSSTPTDLTKISKIPAMTKKVVTVGVVSPQQSRKVAELEVSTISKTPEVNHSQDSADSISKPLPRPNNFTKSTTVDTSAEVISKQKDALSPTSPPGRPILPYTTFSGVNVKAKAAQLISPSAKKNIMAGSSSSAAGMKGAAPLPPPPTPVGNSKLASQVNGTISTGDLGSTNTSPPGLHGTKRASPRGTPPPVPNKPTLIPQKLAASTTTPSPLSTSVTSSPSLSSQGTKSSTTPPPPPPPPIVNKRPDSLVEARKLFYANKHGSVTCDNPNSVHVRSTTTHNINSNNSNNYRSSSDVFDIDVPPSLDRFPAAPVPVKVGLKMENEQDSCSLNDHYLAMLPCQSALAQNAVWHCMFSSQGNHTYSSCHLHCKFCMSPIIGIISVILYIFMIHELFALHQFSFIVIHFQ